MRRIIFCLFIIALALATAFRVPKDESIAQLKSRFDAARLEDRPELGIAIAQAQLRNADNLYNQGKEAEAREAVADIAAYTEKARDAAIETKKRLKNVEIDARKMADKLRDIKRTLAVDDQPPLETAIVRLEEVRTALLKEMFANDKKKEKK
jgi:hypothetical protein